MKRWWMQLPSGRGPGGGVRSAAAVLVSDFTALRDEADETEAPSRKDAAVPQKKRFNWESTLDLLLKVLQCPPVAAVFFFFVVTRFRIRSKTFHSSFICVLITLGKRFKQISSVNNGGRIRIFNIRGR